MCTNVLEMRVALHSQSLRTFFLLCQTLWPNLVSLHLYSSTVLWVLISSKAGTSLPNHESWKIIIQNGIFSINIYSKMDHFQNVPTFPSLIQCGIVNHHRPPAMLKIYIHAENYWSALQVLYLSGFPEFLPKINMNPYK